MFENEYGEKHSIASTSNDRKVFQDQIGETVLACNEDCVMKKKRYPLNGNGFKLKRAEIIDLSQCYSDMHSIDVRKLMEMTEEEIIANVDPDIVKEVCFKFNLAII